MDRAFLTGCDANTEWMLEWFLKNYRKHNDTPIIFADFGVSDEMRAYALQFFDDYFPVQRGKAKGWFLKPKALLEAKAREVCWIDTDIEVLGDLTGIWNYVEDNKLAMVEDRPWTKRMGSTWFNSGVVAIRNKPDILVKWEHNCRTRPNRGDQETLHFMLDTSPMLQLMHISQVPNIYNWLRLQIHNDNEDSPKKLAMHWTGDKGKNIIRKKMYNE